MGLIPGGQQQETILVGGVTLIKDSTFKSLRAYTNAGTKSTFRVSGGSSGYTPASGKVFTAKAFRIYILTAVSGNYIGQICDSGTQDMGPDSSSAITSPTYPGGDAKLSYLPANGLSNGAVVDGPIDDFAIIATHFLTYIGVGALQAIIEVFGHER